MEKRLELAQKIDELLKKYGKKVPKSTQWASPDASCMEAFGQHLKDPDLTLSQIHAPFSDFHQGGYINKKEAEQLHDEILKDFEKLMTFQCSGCDNLVSIQFNFCPYCGKKV